MSDRRVKHTVHYQVDGSSAWALVVPVDGSAPSLVRVTWIFNKESIVSDPKPPQTWVLRALSVAYGAPVTWQGACTSRAHEMAARRALRPEWGAAYR